MPAVTQFAFYDDPVLKTGGSTCTIDWAAQTFTLPGQAALPFALADEVADTINAAADQNLTDFVGESEHPIYHPTTGVLVLTVVASIAPGVPPAVTGIRPGGAVVDGPTKARDLADGLDLYITGA